MGTSGSSASDRSGAKDSNPSMTGSSSTGSSTTSSSTPGASGSSTTTGQSTTTAPASRTTMSSSNMNRALEAPGSNQMMASDIRGTRVYGANNENVGDINDILLAQDGQIVALVVGVGGFLGIGQKDVPFRTARSSS